MSGAVGVSARRLSPAAITTRRASKPSRPLRATVSGLVIGRTGPIPRGLHALRPTVLGTFGLRRSGGQQVARALRGRDGWDWTVVQLAQPIGPDELVDRWTLLREPAKSRPGGSDAVGRHERCGGRRSGVDVEVRDGPLEPVGERQLALPRSCMTEGTSTIRTWVASTRMATARPRPKTSRSFRRQLRALARRDRPPTTPRTVPSTTSSPAAEAAGGVEVPVDARVNFRREHRMRGKTATAADGDPDRRANYSDW